MIKSAVKKHLGWSGALLGSKTRYKSKNPKNLVIFNANVCTDDGKIWWGDLDITKSEKNLVELAKTINKTIYVLYEMDGRFENEKQPRIDCFVYKADENGYTEIRLSEYFIRNKRGKIQRKSK